MPCLKIQPEEPLPTFNETAISQPLMPYKVDLAHHSQLVAGHSESWKLAQQTVVTESSTMGEDT